MGQGGDSAEWFFQAMAYQQLGDKPQARKLYERAALWMEKNRPHDPKLDLFRAEAEELLGIAARPATQADK